MKLRRMKLRRTKVCQFFEPPCIPCHLVFVVRYRPVSFCFSPGLRTYAPGSSHCSVSPSTTAQPSTTAELRKTSAVGSNDNASEDLSDFRKFINRDGGWPGTDSVMESYYRYEIGEQAYLIRFTISVHASSVHSSLVVSRRNPPERTNRQNLWRPPSVIKIT